MTMVETEKGLNIEVFFNHFSFQRNDGYSYII